MKLKALTVTAAFSILTLLGGCGTDTVKEQTTNAENTQIEETEYEDLSDTEAEQEASQDIFAMDTYMSVTAYGSNAGKAVEEAAAEIQRLDHLLSTGNEESEIAQLNLKKQAVLSEDLVERALELNTETEGAFDIAIYPIMEAWGFTTQNYQVPQEETLQSLLELTDASKIRYNSDTREISFEKEGMEIDLGGIAKGYTSAKIMDIFKANNVTSGLVNLGGNVQVLGNKTDGNPWRVAIQNPDDEEDYLGVLSVCDKAVITSGGYERYFEEDGQTYHHIIDPKTGYPADNGLTSVTIVSADGTLADGLSTSLFIMGKEKAVEFWRAHSDEFDAILLTDDGTLYVTEGIQDDFSTNLTMEIVEK